jgi:hypothetical protein
MKILSQHGYGEGNKTSTGLEEGYIDGVVFRPRDILPEKLNEKCEEIRQKFKHASVLFDPQLYAGVLTSDARASLGKLEEYTPYFRRVVLGALEREKNVVETLERVLLFQRSLNVTSAVSPNIIIRRSFDSREGVIAKNFIRLCKGAWSELEDKREVYASLVVSRDALMQREELQEFLNDITTLETPPDGFYLVIGTSSGESRSDIFNADVISGWMLLNYSLEINGFKVVNGYSDLLSPFLCAVGGDMGCTGWWSNTRSFSMDQFATRQPGGNLPVQRYLCNALLNRIRFDEFRAWKELVPEIVNDLDTDDIFSDKQEEPERAKEVIQSWQALTVLCDDLAGRSVRRNLEKAEERIRAAGLLYDRLESLGLRPDVKSNRDHLDPLSEGITLFRRIAEI